MNCFFFLAMSSFVRGCRITKMPRASILVKVERVHFLNPFLFSVHVNNPTLFFFFSSLQSYPCPDASLSQASFLLRFVTFDARSPGIYGK